jgi:hypothetical protein
MFEFGASHKEWITEGLPVIHPRFIWQRFRQADLSLPIRLVPRIACLPTNDQEPYGSQLEPTASHLK